MDQVSAPPPTPPTEKHPTAPDLEGQARAWVRLMASGEVRAEDAQRMQRWCTTSPAHAAAFREAAGMWRKLGPAAEQLGASDPELAAIRRAVAQAKMAPAANQRRSSLSRRAFLGGAVAASAAAVGVMLVHPPLDMWPSLAALQSDYRTGVGQQLQVALAPDVALQLNTRSSVAVRSREGDTVGIDLIDGEVAVNTSRPFTMRAGDGRIESAGSRFEVRKLDGEVCVTCLEGEVRVQTGGNRQTLQPNQQLVYAASAASRPVLSRVDAQAQADWQRGVVTFRQTALAKVVSEINRYRPGRLVLATEAVQDQPVSGRFRIAEMDKAIAQIQHLFRLKATTLPGGIVILT